MSGVSGLELRRGSGSMGLGYNALGSHRNEDNEFQVPGRLFRVCCAVSATTI